LPGPADMNRLFVILLLLAAPGCLPYGCSRTEPRVLSPADSLSRAYSETVRVDTLQPTGTLDTAFEYPRTLGFAPDGALYVTDTGNQRLVSALPDGTERSWALDTLRFPYLAGFVGSTPMVYSPDAHVVFAVQELGISASWRVPDEGGELHYAVVAGRDIWIKVLGEDFPGFLGRVDSSLTVVERIPLPGPYWRYAGLLRSWMGEPLSLSGFLPLVHRIGDGGLDSLALYGFDSPMLARTRQFLRGDVDAPPLLTASAAPVDSTLYVLNMRPGWLRVDSYGADGKLAAVYVEPDPEFNQDFLPTDLAVRATDTGFELAVAVAKPEPQVRLYRFTRP